MLSFGLLVTPILWWCPYGALAAVAAGPNAYRPVAVGVSALWGLHDSFGVPKSPQYNCSSVFLFFSLNYALMC